MRSLRMRFAGAVIVGAVVGWFATGQMTIRAAGASSDQPPSRRTGAPGESTCNGCHGPASTINDGQGLLQIPGLPATYVPGDTYPIGILIGRTGQTRWGFEITCLTTSGDLPAGTFGNPTLFTATQTGIVSGQTRNYATQTTLNLGVDGTYDGVLNGTGWVVDWTAPPAGAGSVTFYAAGVAANSDDAADDGDGVYTATATMAEESSTPVTTTTWGAIKRAIR